MTFYEEYNSFFKDLGPVGTAGYKFFDAFKFDYEEKTISFHTDYEHTFDDMNLFKEFQNYVKQEKKHIRAVQKDIDKDNALNMNNTDDYNDGDPWGDELENNGDYN